MTRRRISLVDISSRRRRVRRALFWGSIFTAVVLLIAGALWVATQSDVFRLTEVNIVGATYVPEEKIQQFLRSHIAQGGATKLLGFESMLAWPKEISGDALKGLPGISSLQVEKHILDRVIEVVVTEKERIGIWCFSKMDPRICFWFDADGILFMPAYYAEGNLIPLLDDYSRDSMELGGQVLSSRFMPNLISIFSSLDSISLSIDAIRLSDLDKEEIEVMTHDGPDLLFSLRFKSAGVPDALEQVADIIPLRDLQYVDFRVENKVYYK